MNSIRQLRFRLTSKRFSVRDLNPAIYVLFWNPPYTDTTGHILMLDANF